MSRVARKGGGGGGGGGGMTLHPQVSVDIAICITEYFQYLAGLSSPPLISAHSIVFRHVMTIG